MDAPGSREAAGKARSSIDTVGRRVSATCAITTC